MNVMKLLLVEDNEQERKTCKATAKRYQREKNRPVEIIEKSSLSNALDILDNTFDGAIVDLRLGIDDYDGNEVIKEISSRYRIPIVVLTGHPRNVVTGIPLLHTYTRGEAGYDEIFDLFFRVYQTGLTNIFGGRGHIEEAMDKIFWQNILPSLEAWQNYAGDGQETEKALLRFTVSQLYEFLNDDTTHFFPEEMYIIPPFTNSVKTGIITKLKDSNTWYIVLSPACDLVLRADGKPKTDRILTCQIEKVSELTSKKDEVKKVVKNNFTPYLHYLPVTRQFPGGVINFRKIDTFSLPEVEKKFDKPYAQISMAFVKDIIARFSSYYSRQGQPDFDSEKLVKGLGY